MKKFNYFFLAIILLFFSCKNNSTSSGVKELDEMERFLIAEQFVLDYNSKNLSSLDTLLTDKITMVDNGEPALMTKQEYINSLEMAIVFNDNLEVTGMVGADEKIGYNVKMNSKRVQFLHERPYEAMLIFKFKGDKISELHFSFTDIDVELLESNWDALFTWLEENDKEKFDYIQNNSDRKSAEYTLEAITEYEKLHNSVSTSTN
ncbi:MAG: hypothetical protein MI922_12725 [Bacteroidales bacterium]|nr:hypothetical protein [Bacteroidales bacterium]